MAEPAPPLSPLVELVAVMHRLRRECPWKAAQTHESLLRHLLEETYEVVEAVEEGDAAHLREELGDLLLQVYFQAAVAEQAGDFDVEDVAADLLAKLVRRNPHVFGEGERVRDGELSAAAVNEVWEAAKVQEKGQRGLMEGVPTALPALLRADKVLDRCSRAGRPVTDEVVAELPDGVGRRLLEVVREAHASGLDPEFELRSVVRLLVDPPLPGHVRDDPTAGRGGCGE